MWLLHQSSEQPGPLHHFPPILQMEIEKQSRNSKLAGVGALHIPSHVLPCSCGHVLVCACVCRPELSKGFFVSFFHIRSHYVALAGLKLSMWTRLGSDWQQSSCLGLLSGGIVTHVLQWPVGVFFVSYMGRAREGAMLVASNNPAILLPPSSCFTWQLG